MTYVIGEACVDMLDGACVKECPVDCICEGERMLYIRPDECVDCGACEPVCPVEAIYYEDDLPEKWQAYAGEKRGPSPSRCPAATSHSAHQAARQARRRGCRHAVRYRASPTAANPACPGTQRLARGGRCAPHRR